MELLKRHHKSANREKQNHVTMHPIIASFLAEQQLEERLDVTARCAQYIFCRGKSNH